MDDRPVRLLGWVRADVTLGGEECDAIGALGSSFVRDSAKVGDAAYGHRRRCTIQRIVPGPASSALLLRLHGLCVAINDAAFGLDIGGILPPDYVEYSAGFGHFDWHSDYAYISAQRARKLTVIVQLSAPDDYEGGELHVFDSGPTSLPRERGAILAFPSFTPHRVTPVTRGLRRSLVLWATGPAFR